MADPLVCSLPAGLPVDGISSPSAFSALCSDACNVSATVADDLTVGTGDKEQNVALAFGLVTAAGLSTSIGAGLVFFDRFVTQTNSLVLAASLGFSAGVMLYVSFGEILLKSVADFEACDCLWEHEDPSSPPSIMATAMFFTGVLLFLALDFIVHRIMPHVAIKRRTKGGDGNNQAKQGEHTNHLPDQTSTSASWEPNQRTQNHASAVPAGTPPGCASVTECCEDELCIEDGVAAPETQQQPATAPLTPPAGVAAASFEAARGEPDHINLAMCMCDHGDDDTAPEVIDLNAGTDEEQQRALNRMGVMTALAIGLHNFPEGLATFAGALADPSVGVALAVAIAIHNIPEGLCVSIPIYYATGSRMRGFALATVSGIAELVGAALGYAFLVTLFGNAAYAVLFGLVAGMMVAIVISELLPTAHRYDPKDKVATKSLFAGMAVMAFSLVLFRL